ncbi:MAG: hypothetical protein ACQETE_14840 [Bacteroidota bacterium]
MVGSLDQITDSENVDVSLSNNENQYTLFYPERSKSSNQRGESLSGT